MGEILNVSVHMKDNKQYFIIPVSVLLITLLLVSTFHFVKNIHLFQKTLSEMTANGSCRTEIARPKGTMVSIFGMQKQ